ncbi:hypothetical protein RRG08_032736 [Elysia crispata]|uniref:Uncharacterized protein n=1 Tax=Elysia crispata TaxID=231223 RepID=A0AAE0YW21_9GAST|nr:hypothetical protein RRG08_032736 [Elysia crispata]
MTSTGWDTLKGTLDNERFPLVAPAVHLAGFDKGPQLGQMLMVAKGDNTSVIIGQRDGAEITGERVVFGSSLEITARRAEMVTVRRFDWRLLRHRSRLVSRCCGVQIAGSGREAFLVSGRTYDRGGGAPGRNISHSLSLTIRSGDDQSQDQVSVVWPGAACHYSQTDQSACSNEASASAPLPPGRSAVKPIGGSHVWW